MKFTFATLAPSVTHGPHPVTRGRYAFMSCRALRSIAIPPSVTVIDEFTFADTRQVAHLLLRLLLRLLLLLLASSFSSPPPAYGFITTA